MSENKLYKKLIDIRKSVEYLQKTERGNQGAMYVDPAVLLRKIRSKMDEHGILLYPEILENVIESMPAPTKNNPNNQGFFFKAVINYIWSDTESDQKIRVPWLATGNHLSDPSMAMGGGLTYSERYFLLKFFQIPTSKDDPEFFKQKTTEIEYIDDEQKANIQALLDETGSDIQAFYNWLKITDLGQIQSQSYDGIVKTLERKRNDN